MNQPLRLRFAASLSGLSGLSRGAHSLGCVSALAIGLLSSSALAQTIVISGATVYPTPDRKLERTTVVIKDGVIVALGANVAIPTGAKQIDGTGKVVTAGLIESATQLGLVEIDLENTSTDGRFGNSPSEVHAAYRSVDAYDARSVAIPVARTGGVTSAITGPSGGLLAGQSAWVSLADAAQPLAPILAPAAMNSALGVAAIASGSRGQAIERLREVLDDAALYDRNRAAFERNQSRKLAAERLDLEALIPVLRGRMPMVVVANAESDLRAALALAKERRIRIVIAGGAEAWRLADELAAANVPVILDPTANLPDELMATDVRDDNATLLSKAGVPVAVSALGNASAARTIRQLAGIAVSNGLTWAQGLASVTSIPAAIFGQPRRGLLAVGGVADLVIWSGDPLEISSRAEVVFIGGVPQSLQTHQTRLRDRYRRLPVKP
jgi:imidazolonepropionase-like amidohydrolase